MPGGTNRVAARVLSTLGFEPPAAWWSLPELAPTGPRGAAYYREHVAPWVRRRLARTSSGDGRMPKFAEWVTVAPSSDA